MDERKTKGLFQQLKQDDAATAPSFAGVLNAARDERKTDGWFKLRAAMIPAAAMLLLLAGGWFVFVRQEQVLLPPLLPEQPWKRTRPRVPGSEEKDFTGKTAPEQPVRHARPRVLSERRTSRTFPVNALVSQWRSPTDFLLKTPGQRWLKDVPRLGAPRIEINPFDFEQKNEMNETEEQ